MSLTKMKLLNSQMTPRGGAVITRDRCEQGSNPRSVPSTT